MKPLCLNKHQQALIYSYELHSHSKIKVRLVGSWKLETCPEGGISLTGSLLPTMKWGLNGRHFIMATVLQDPPYQKAFIDQNGNVVERGLTYDILQHLAGLLNFTYKLVPSIDGKYGVQNDDGSWSGMVGMIVRKEVDMAVGSPLIDETRSGVVGSLLWILNHSSQSSINCARAFLSAVNRRGLFSIQNCIFHIFGTTAQQGGIWSTTSLPAQTLLALWWIYVILLNAHYVGVLISFLTTKQSFIFPILGLNGLVNTEEYKPGFVSGNIPISAFQNANSGDMKEIWDKLCCPDTKPEFFYENLEQGLHKVFHNEHALIGPESILDYHMFQTYQTQGTCDFVFVPERLFKYYGTIFLFPDKSPWVSIFNNGILSLIQSGMIMVWWEKYGYSVKYCQDIGSIKASEIQIKLVAAQGLFWILVVGLTLASFALMCEILTKRFYHRPNKIQKCKLNKGCYALNFRNVHTAHEIRKQIRELESVLEEIEREDVIIQTGPSESCENMVEINIHDGEFSNIN